MCSRSPYDGIDERCRDALPTERLYDVKPPKPRNPGIPGEGVVVETRKAR